jgi:hypothetical protein
MLMRNDRCGETIAIVATVAAFLFPRRNMLVSDSNPIAINFDWLVGPRRQLTTGCYNFAKGHPELTGVFQDRRSRKVRAVLQTTVQ